MIKRIHVNQNLIRKNIHAEEKEPVITVRTSKGNSYGFKVDIQGSSSVVYSPEKPLSCGARLWIETEAPVLVDGVMIP